MDLKCLSCHKNLKSEENFTQFECPECGKTIIIRCKTCRMNGTPYDCKECGFEGP